MSSADSPPTASDVFFPLQFDKTLPALFPSPFEVVPHSVAEQAAASLKSRIPHLCDDKHLFETSNGGKMFGVLVVKNANNETGYLSAFSGMLGQDWNIDGFVPPVFDQAMRAVVQREGECQLLELSNTVEQLQSDVTFVQLQQQLLDYQNDADAALCELKDKQLDRKNKRKAQRESSEIDERTLKTLANESRGDKIAFKKLKLELQESGVELREQVDKYQSKIDNFIQQRKKMSRRLQIELFKGYKLCNTSKYSAVISDLFKDGLPPSGAGDCAAVKLVQCANLYRLQAVALAEFWWGAPPVGGLRQHGRYYPACRSRCRVLLPFMLNGHSIATPKHEQGVHYSNKYPITLYEDDDIVLVEKPFGLLSVPGKVLVDSVETRLKGRYPLVEGVMLLHRLDQATSGVMIAAKHPRAYKSLQHQFEARTIKKRYIAILDGQIEEHAGTIELPLRLDYYDRPRQIVCSERGKKALTYYEVISQDTNESRVAFYPHTGRTHQLRVHAAHPDGLNCPILGDELYGQPLNRLHLHAEEITFDHPVSGSRMSIASQVPF